MGIEDTGFFFRKCGDLYIPRGILIPQKISPSASPSGGCDECTDNLILSCHFENNDDIEQGTPCGCNTNADTTWEKTGATYSSTQKSDGTFSIYKNGNQSAVIMTDMDRTLGTLIFDVYITTLTNWDPMMSFQIDSNNYLEVRMRTGGDCSLYYKGNGTERYVTEANDRLTLNTWHTVRVKWRSATSAYLSIDIDNNTPATSGVAITAMVGTMSGLRVGDPDWTETSVFYLDNVKLYNIWTP